MMEVKNTNDKVKNLLNILKREAANSKSAGAGAGDSTTN